MTSEPTYKDRNLLIPPEYRPKRLAGNVSVFRNNIMNTIQDVVVHVDRYINRPRIYSGIESVEWGGYGDTINITCGKPTPHNTNRRQRSVECMVFIKVTAYKSTGAPYTYDEMWETSEELGLQGKLAVAMTVAIAHVECSPSDDGYATYEGYRVLSLLLRKEDLSAAALSSDSPGHLHLLKIMRSIHKFLRDETSFKEWLLNTRSSAIKDYQMIDDILV